MENYVVLSKEGKEIETDISLHPGEVLAMEIEARNIKKGDMANMLGIKPSNLTDLLKGKRHVSPLMALKIEMLLGIEASFWLRVQLGYDLKMAKKKFTKSMTAKLRKSQKYLTNNK